VCEPLGSVLQLAVSHFRVEMAMLDTVWNLWAISQFSDVGFAKNHNQRTYFKFIINPGFAFVPDRSLILVFGVGLIQHDPLISVGPVQSRMEDASFLARECHEVRADPALMPRGSLSNPSLDLRTLGVEAPWYVRLQLSKV